MLILWAHSLKRQWKYLNDGEKNGTKSNIHYLIPPYHLIMNNTTLQVHGMHCASCANIITRKISKMP